MKADAATAQAKAVDDNVHTRSHAMLAFPLRFARAVPLSFLDSPRASNADPFSCLLAFRASRLFSFTALHCRQGGGMEQGLGANRHSATVLHWCNVSTSSCPHALQGRSIPTTHEGAGIFFAHALVSPQRVAAKCIP
ncbi:MAG: hypothetical protein LBJ65_16555 [Burkholderia sp.]|uniref:hypothetical protein n=1 Tax=Burkholderia sp. TaxID=36773 RepID=UPI002816DA71|nr:hypothetical protein [Burkholderia sp.]MDR0243211.1 hypothetical protein [Burkholderia sp.]